MIQRQSDRIQVLGFRAYFERILGKGSFEVYIGSRKITMRNNTDDLGILEEVSRKDLYRIDQRVIQHIYRKGNASIVDIGGHIGISTVVLLNQLPSIRKKVLVYEPHPENFALLSKNLVDDPDVELCNFAIGNFTGSVGMCIPQQSDGFQKFAWNHLSALENGAQEISVNMITMSDPIQRVGGFIDILKFDAEGAEQYVDWLNVLPNVGVLMLETHEGLYPGSCNSLLDAISDVGFNTICQSGNDHQFINPTYL